MFKDLKEGDRPLSPLPPDNMSDIQYPQFIEPRCSLCTSAFRDLAEHVYLESGKKPQVKLAKANTADAVAITQKD
jgi:hypothetical protein